MKNLIVVFVVIFVAFSCEEKSKDKNESIEAKESQPIKQFSRIKSLKFYNEEGLNTVIDKFEYNQNNSLSSISIFVDWSNTGIPSEPENSLKYKYSKGTLEMEFYGKDSLLWIMEHVLNEKGNTKSTKMVSPKKDDIFEKQDFNYNESEQLIEVILPSAKCQFMYKDGNKITYKNNILKADVNEEISYDYYFDLKDIAGLGSNRYLYDNLYMYGEGFTIGKTNVNLIKSITKKSGEKSEYIYQLNKSGYVTQIDVTITSPENELRKFFVKIDYY